MKNYENQMPTIIEEWKDIPNAPGYKASNWGNIMKGDKLMNQCKTGNYLGVSVKMYGKHRMYYIHRLVAMAFLTFDHNDRKIHIDHRNDNKHDNRLNNLYPLSSRDNTLRGMKAKSSSLCVGVSKQLVKSKSKIYEYWVTQIRINDIPCRVGSFKTEQEAYFCYQNAQRLQHNFNGDLKEFRKILRSVK